MHSLPASNADAEVVLVEDARYLIARAYKAGIEAGQAAPISDGAGADMADAYAKSALADSAHDILTPRLLILGGCETDEPRTIVLGRKPDIKPVSQ
jgi:hypothetical protein